MKNYFCALLLLPFFVGCAASDDSTSTPPGATFSVQAQLSSRDVSRFTVGCVKPGVAYGASVLSVDPRLKLGMTMQSIYTSIDDKSVSHSAAIETTVVGLPSKGLVTADKLLSSLNLGATTLAAATTSNCTEGTNGLACSSLWASADVPNAVDAASQDCQFTDASKQIELAKGVFTFGDGVHSVNAYRSRNKLPGTIACSNGTHEAGILNEEIIYSNELPGLRAGFATCGGEVISQNQILAGASGKIYWTRYYEVLTLQ